MGTSVTSPSPDCAVNHVPRPGQRARPRYALSNSFGFGGINACLALGAWGVGHCAPGAADRARVMQDRAASG